MHEEFVKQTLLHMQRAFFPNCNKKLVDVNNWFPKLSLKFHLIPETDLELILKWASTNSINRKLHIGIRFQYRHISPKICFSLKPICYNLQTLTICYMKKFKKLTTMMKEHFLKALKDPHKLFWGAPTSFFNSDNIFRNAPGWTGFDSDWSSESTGWHYSELKVFWYFQGK